jgi:hypothetical protein
MKRCRWCRSELSLDCRNDTLSCGRKCRQAAFRLRRARATTEAVGSPLTFAYADPPYPGRAKRYYRDEEVDHRALIAQLQELAPAGWALSTAEDSLRALLPLCPPPPLSRVCAWVKPIGPCPRTYGLHGCWEPLIVVGGRRRRPGKRNWLRAQPARGGGSLPGRKPQAFCLWLFECLGMQPGDTLLDLFPGTGIVGRSWALLSSRSSATDGGEVSPGAPGDASPRPGALHVAGGLHEQLAFGEVR